MDSFDWVVIGSGPAGEKSAAQAAYFGKRVAMCHAFGFAYKQRLGSQLPAPVLCGFL